ncbi:hypothetical protein ACOMHN_001794 [Nucella lapillus]
MITVWLVLVVVILITRALHCYLHYRAGCQGVPLPSHDLNGSDAQTQTLLGLARTDPETRPSQSQMEKKRQRSPRRRCTSRTAQAV